MKKTVLIFTLFLFLLAFSNVCLLTAQTNVSREWTDKSPHRENFVEANGVKLQYLDWGGAGEAIVFLTGLGVSAHIFDDLAPKFNDRFRVLSYTRRGLYKSTQTSDGYDTETLTEDLRGFLDALKIKKATFIGWSLGGTEMTRFATLYPERVNRLIYLESAYDYATLPEIWAKDPIAVNPTDADMESWEASKDWFQKVYGFWSNAVEADGRAVNLQPNGTVKLQTMPPEIMGKLLEGMTQAKPDFSKIKAPVLAFYAVSNKHPFISSAPNAEIKQKGNDYWKDIFSADQQKQISNFKRAIPTAKIVVLRDAQHLCFIKKSDETKIVMEINAFLQKS